VDITAVAHGNVTMDANWRNKIMNKKEIELKKKEQKFLMENINLTLISSKVKKEKRKRLLTIIKKATKDKNWNKCYDAVLNYRLFEPKYVAFETFKETKYQVLLNDLRPAYYIQYTPDLAFEYISCLNELYEIGFQVEGGPLIVYNTDKKNDAVNIAKKACSILKKYLYPPASNFFEGNPAESIYVYRNIDGEYMWRKVDDGKILNLKQLIIHEKTLM
jgi:hypothetical protein